MVLVSYMMINTYHRIDFFFYHRVYLISAMASSTSLTPFILFTALIFPILSTLLTLPILCFLIFGAKRCNMMVFIYLKVLTLKCLL